MAFGRAVFHGIWAVVVTVTLCACGDDAKLTQKNKDLQKELADLQNENAALKGARIIVPERYVSDHDVRNALGKRCDDYRCYLKVGEADQFLSLFERFADPLSHLSSLNGESVGKALSAAVLRGPGADGRTEYSAGAIRYTAIDYYPDLQSFLTLPPKAFNAAVTEARNRATAKVRDVLANPANLRALYRSNRPAITAAVVDGMDAARRSEFVEFVGKAADVFQQMTDAGMRDCVGKRLDSGEVHFPTRAGQPVIGDAGLQSCLARAGADARQAAVYAFAYRRWREGGDTLLGEYRQIAADLVASVVRYVNANGTGTSQQ